MNTAQAHTGPLVVRLATTADRTSLQGLAELDSAPPPAGATLIAELRGRPVAALSIADGDTVADPFTPTSDIVELLQLRATQLTPRLAPHGSATRLRSKRTRRVRSQRSPWR